MIEVDFFSFLQNFCIKKVAVNSLICSGQLPIGRKLLFLLPSLPPTLPPSLPPSVCLASFLIYFSFSMNINPSHNLSVSFFSIPCALSTSDFLFLFWQPFFSLSNSSSLNLLLLFEFLLSFSLCVFPFSLSFLSFLPLFPPLPSLASKSQKN